VAIGVARRGGQKPLAISVLENPISRPFSSVASAWPKRIVFGQAERILLQRDLSGRLTCAGLLQCLPVIPGHPVRRVLGQFLGVLLQFDQELEGIDAV
jgi:hypothetical protein